MFDIPALEALVLSSVHAPAWWTWGLCTLLAANVGYWIPALLLEAVGSVAPDWIFLTYNGQPRREALAKTYAKVPRAKQIAGAAWTMLGLPALANAAVAALLLGAVMPVPETALPTAWAFAADMALLLLLNDFFLYWGHRVQHENEWLWLNCHSVHHAVQTPTPFSTVYIDEIDGTLQAGLPMVLAGTLVRAHPVTWWVFVTYRLAENVVNHSGLDSRLVDVLTLKMAPLRAGVAHHDAHHRYSNYAANAKNYAEGFWVWDYLFGTLRPQLSRTA